MRTSLRSLLVFVLIVSSWGSDYKVALPGYQYRFPKDHFNHPEYQTEWWYYTGNVKSPEGHRFGFELTFFRQGIARDRDSSPWHIHDLYMAHLALSDLSGGHFYHTERINRAGPGIAGVDERSGLIWNGNWQAELRDGSHRVRGISEKFGVQVDLSPQKGPVIHGRNGISQKAEGRGHASHYISFSRLLTSGSIELNGTKYRVDGTSWMDHEFFTNSIPSNESGWDWLSVQLEDKTELMLYRLRHKDGHVDPYSSGTYIDAEGRSFFLSSKDFSMTPGGEVWTSNRTGARYPIYWHVSIPTIAIDMDVATPLANQELSTAIGPSYWEGAIDVTARRSGAPIKGVGYLEMTGYSATPESNFMP